MTFSAQQASLLLVHALLGRQAGPELLVAAASVTLCPGPGLALPLGRLEEPDKL